MRRGRNPPAVAAASAAFPAWSARTPLQRGAYLRAWEQAIKDNLEDLAKILTLEEGKPLAEARGEILQGASYFPWFAEECRRVCGDVTPSFRPGTQALTRHAPWAWPRPITPWNFPFSMLPRKAAPALAAGCTIVVKPAGPHALQRSGPGRAGHARGHSRRGHQCADRRRVGHRRRNRGQSHGAQGQLHRLHGGGQATGRRLRAHAQAHVPGTGRQRALYGL